MIQLYSANAAARDELATSEAIDRGRASLTRIP